MNNITENDLKHLGFVNKPVSLVRTSYQYELDESISIEISWHNAEPSNKVFGFRCTNNDDCILTYWKSIESLEQAQTIINFFRLLNK